jgi:hypothetical protein
MGSRGFRCHNSRPAVPIEMRSKNGIMLDSRGTIHMVDIKNWFMQNRVTRDTKLALFG